MGQLQKWPVCTRMATTWGASHSGSGVLAVIGPIIGFPIATLATTILNIALSQQRNPAEIRRRNGHPALVKYMNEAIIFIALYDAITMSNTAPACPQCTLANPYLQGSNFICGDHEVNCELDGGSFVLKACFLKKA